MPGRLRRWLCSSRGWPVLAEGLRMGQTEARHRGQAIRRSPMPRVSGKPGGRQQLGGKWQAGSGSCRHTPGDSAGI